MDLQLEGRRALVTGSSSGIGEAAARALAAEGTAVVVHGRSADEAKRVAWEIQAAGGQAEPVTVDLLGANGPEDLAAAALRLLGGIDILVHSAASGLEQPWDSTDPAEWRMLYDLNVLAAVRLAQRLVPGMRRRGWGRVIHIASGAATEPQPASLAYSVTKAAVVNLTVGLARALDRTGVTVNTVSPGIVVTPRVQRYAIDLAAAQGWGGDWDGIEQRILRETMDNPCGRLGRPFDVAALVTFLASPLAGFVNGANHRVDGAAIGVVN